jgi:hypothetical protein
MMHIMNSKLINDTIAELTHKLNLLTLKVHDYQAKATKVRELPNWIPMSCKSGFALSAPNTIPNDDPCGLLKIREDVAAIQHTYGTDLCAAVRCKELLLLKKALHKSCEDFISQSLDIATNWLSLWRPKNAKLLHHTPLPIIEDQVVGLIFK